LLLFGCVGVDAGGDVGTGLLALGGGTGAGAGLVVRLPPQALKQMQHMITNKMLFLIMLCSTFTLHY
jgi:hypothetical protein